MSKPLRWVPQAAQSVEFSCPLCASVHAAYIFRKSQLRIFRCAGCALTFSNKRARLPEISEIDDGMPARTPSRGETRHATFMAALDAASFDGPVLVITEADDEIIGLIERRGIEIGRVVGPDNFGSADWGGRYNGAIVSPALMRFANPREVLRKIHAHMVEGGSLVLSVPLLDSPQAHLLGRRWQEWRSSNLWYFTKETLHLLLLSAGFAQVWFQAERRPYTLDHIVRRMRGPEPTLFQRGLEAITRIAPDRIRNRDFSLPSGTSVVTAAAVPERSKCVLSIIVPVFNERATLQEILDTLLTKHLPGLDKEIIIVESGSTDGSRELVESYAANPQVKVVLQPSPRGKGNAVREGLKMATGDIVMIQDADLEYDFDDYDGLLAPVVGWQSMFVLGSRHQEGWKMRKFTGAPVTAAMFNIGHAFFRTLINLALRSKMADPFTMFKVIRRDAIFGLDFVCNRFDFDIELVIKLVRKGYEPLELPVNYTSRSFAEGKKVSVTRDSLTWVWTILKSRFSRLGRRP